MAYVAVRRMRTTEGERLPGDAVPEAAGWKNLRSYMGSHLIEVPDNEVATPVAKPKAEKPKRRARKAKAEVEASEPEVATPVAEEPQAQEAADETDATSADDWEPELG